MPLIILQRHWLTIETIIDRKVFQDDTLTLTTFEEAGAFTPEMLDPIVEVSGQASAEQALETILKKVEYVWKETELSVIAHRESKDVFILAGLDELQLLLDESYININTLAASRHVKPIKTRVEEWQRMLDLFTSTLEEWTTCQTSWMYLEAIFSAPDIQRQLPTEARMFMAVDKTWKDIMRKAYKQPLALPQMTDEKTYETMKQNNVLLDKITKCLEAYLEVKRVSFPRYNWVHKLCVLSKDVFKYCHLDSTFCPTTNCWRSWRRRETRMLFNRICANASMPLQSFSLVQRRLKAVRRL